MVDVLEEADPTRFLSLHVVRLIRFDFIEGLIYWKIVNADDELREVLTKEGLQVNVASLRKARENLKQN